MENECRIKLSDGDGKGEIVSFRYESDIASYIHLCRMLRDRFDGGRDVKGVIWLDTGETWHITACFDPGLRIWAIALGDGSPPKLWV